MATATTRPAILVVGRPEADAYMTIFRLANDGMLPYDEALLVEGQPRVDRYTLEQLKPFDAVFLHGYDYKDGLKAWDILASYVQQGGSLFVDTGWEYWIPEWEFEKAPDVLPVDRLTWTDYGMATEYELGVPEAAGTVDISRFKPLIWEGAPWTLSGAEAGDVREWGRVVLSAGGRPLIVAGEYGQGKVVWSGMNLIGHARYGDPNTEEFLFLGNLMRWLTSGRHGLEFPAPNISREDPDRVGLSFAAAPGDVTWLFWREAFYPNWHAYLTDSAGERELPIYRGGPGFMLMPIESVADVANVRLEWLPSPAERIAVIVSGVGILLVTAMILDGLFLQGNGFTWVKIALIMRTPKPFLGEGSNREWAERKRRELTEGELAPGPRIYQPNEAIPWMRPEAEIASEASGPANSNGQDLEVPETIEEHEKLLESWLSETGHSDDAWAERLLGKRPPDRETWRG